MFGIAESVAGDFTAALKKSETGDPRMKIEPVGAKPIAVHHKAKQQGSSTSSPSAHRKPYRPK